MLRHTSRSAVGPVLLALSLLCPSIAAAAEPASGTGASETSPTGRRLRAWGRASDETPSRPFMIGLEGVVMQAAPLRTDLVQLDPRSVGRSVALGGLGVFGRYRYRPVIGFDFNVRSGSIRYRDRDKEHVVSQDQILADLGVLLYLGRGQVAQFALSGGVGGMFNRVGYDIDGRGDGRQLWGSGVVRVGAEGEFLIKRVAFVLSFRAYGVFTNREAASNRGELFDADPTDYDAPVAALQTMLVGSAGVAFRF